MSAWEGFSGQEEGQTAGAGRAVEHGAEAPQVGAVEVWRYGLQFCIWAYFLRPVCRFWDSTQLVLYSLGSCLCCCSTAGVNFHCIPVVFRRRSGEFLTSVSLFFFFQLQEAMAFTFYYICYVVKRSGRAFGDARNKPVYGQLIYTFLFCCSSWQSKDTIRSTPVFVFGYFGIPC